MDTVKFAGSMLFLSTLSLRRATLLHLYISCHNKYFYPRSPCGERPLGLPADQPSTPDFYPRSPCGERRPPSVTPTASRNFYPRSPCGERPLSCLGRTTSVLFLSTLSLRRATNTPTKAYNIIVISIHALLAESDRPMLCPLHHQQHFYPRSPCGERQANLQRNQHQRKHFYPRSPCGERRAVSVQVGGDVYFYPRSPCGERLNCSRNGFAILYFYPRSPCGERPVAASTSDVSANISIHALLAESDFIT